MRENGVDEEIIAEIRAYDRIEFNSDRRFYVHSNEMAEYIENTAGKEQDSEVITVLDLLNEIESRNLYYELLALDQSVLQFFAENSGIFYKGDRTAYAAVGRRRVSEDAPAEKETAAF